MPSADFYYLSDGDLGDIIAYVKSVPPVEKEWAKPNLFISGDDLMQLGAFGDVYSVEVINHTAPRPVAAKPGATAEYGDYLVKVGGFLPWQKELSGGRPEPCRAAWAQPHTRRRHRQVERSRFHKAMRTRRATSGIH